MVQEGLKQIFQVSFNVKKKYVHVALGVRRLVDHFEWEARVKPV